MNQAVGADVVLVEAVVVGEKHGLLHAFLFWLCLTPAPGQGTSAFLVKSNTINTLVSTAKHLFLWDVEAVSINVEIIF